MGAVTIGRVARQGEALPPLTEADYAAAIEAHIDAVARTRGYRNADRLASYVGGTVAQWAAEAAEFVSWRDSVWLYAYAEMTKVLNGQRAQPSIDELIAELPVIAWPETD